MILSLHMYRLIKTNSGGFLWLKCERWIHVLLNSFGFSYAGINTILFCQYALDKIANNKLILEIYK